MTEKKLKQEKQKKMDRNQKAIQEAQLKKQMSEPINQFMNAFDKDGKRKYPIAEKLNKYFLNNPDPVMNAMRMSNALLHELRWHKLQSSKYYQAYKVGGDDNKMFDKYGKLMSPEDCYVAYIQERQVCFTVMQKLRQNLVSNLLSTVDNNLFTFDMFNDYVENVDKIVKELGHELFPEDLKIIKPM